MAAQTTDSSELNDAAQVLWTQGCREDAIRLLVEVLNQTPHNLPRTPCLQLAYYLFQGEQFRSAETILSQYLKQSPQDYEALENRGVVRLRMKNIQGAYLDFQQVVAHRPESVNAWDALTSALSRFGKNTEAQQSGAQALRLKDQQCRKTQAVQITVPHLSPQQWDERHRDRQDIIAFSLWGSNPIYLRGAIRNLLEAPKLYPGWICRFYVDPSVPDEFSELVLQLGGQIVAELPGQSQRQKLGWRFQVAADLNVRRFLVRDADSVISQREVNAVTAWLKGDRWFHVMRDWWSHTDLILAGLWGGRAGILEPLAPRLRAYHSGRLETANIDQWFLRDCVWGAIREYCLIHDRYFEVLGARPWPDRDPGASFHVGQNESAVRATQQTQLLGELVNTYSWLQLPPSCPP